MWGVFPVGGSLVSIGNLDFFLRHPRRGDGEGKNGRKQKLLMRAEE